MIDGMNNKNISKDLYLLLHNLTISMEFVATKNGESGV